MRNLSRDDEGRNPRSVARRDLQLVLVATEGPTSDTPLEKALCSSITRRRYFIIPTRGAVFARLSHPLLDLDDNDLLLVSYLTA